MRRRISGMISMLLAAVMAMSMVLTGFAAETEPLAASPNVKGSIEIDNTAEGETYSIYKMFDLTYSDYDTDDETASPDSYSYKVVDIWSAFFTAGAGAAYITINSDGYVTTVSFESDSPEAAAFAKAALAYAGDNDITPTNSVEASGEYVTFENLDLGYYLVDTSLGTLCMLTSTDPNAVIEEKNSVPIIQKLVDLTAEESIDNNSSVQYELIVENIKGVSHLVIHDKMMISGGYEFKLGGTNDSLIVTLVDGDSKTLVIGADYVVETESLGDGCDFHIAFTVNNTDYDFSGCSDNARIEVIFDCTIDAGQLTFEDDEVVIPNTAMVSYGAQGESEWAEADIYEYGFEVFKYTGTDTPLAGAEFQFSKTVDGSVLYAVFEDGTNYVLDHWASDPEDAGTVVSDESGIIYIDGLAEGDYTLTEIAAPDGYNMLLGPIALTLNVDTTDPKVFTVTYTYSLANGNTQTGTVDSDDYHRIRVLNNSGSILPGTGGMGTTIFYVVGIVLVIGAAVLFITKKRLEK